MNTYVTPFTLALLLCASGVHAQMYKSVAPDGRVTYSDQPPAGAARTEKKQLTNSVVDGIGLPFELAQVAKASPVTLFTGSNCAPCEEARTLLGARGIPFAEKTVSTNADIALVSGISGGTEIELPQMQVGQRRQRGFDVSAWNANLTAAGYPINNILPKSYKNASPQAAAPVVRGEIVTVGDPDDATAASPRVRRNARRSATPAPAESGTTNPPGFRF